MLNRITEACDCATFDKAFTDKFFMIVCEDAHEIMQEFRSSYRDLVKHSIKLRPDDVHNKTQAEIRDHIVDTWLDMQHANPMFCENYIVVAWQEHHSTRKYHFQVLCLREGSDSVQDVVAEDMRTYLDLTRRYPSLTTTATRDEAYRIYGRAMSLTS